MFSININIQYYQTTGFILTPKQCTISTSINNITKQQDLFKDYTKHRYLNIKDKDESFDRGRKLKELEDFWSLVGK